MALPVRKGYSGSGVTTTLTSSPTISDTTFTVAAVTNWPNTFPFFIVVEPGTVREEKMKVTGISTLTLTVVRGQDNTSAAAHGSGSTCYPVFTASEADEANLIASVMTTKGDIISTDGSTINRLAVGGTNTHVLQVDSTATNGIKWGQVATAGIADNAVSAAKLATAVADLLCPVGTIIPYAGATSPNSSWLLCDGSSFNATTYATLNTLLGGNNTPDLRGRFLLGDDASLTLRGTGGSTTIGTNNLPSHTHDLKSHTHTMQNHTHDMKNHTHSLSSHTHTVSGGVTVYDSGTSGNWGLIATNQTGNVNAYIQSTVSSPTGGPSTNTSGTPSDNTSGGPSNNTTAGPSDNTSNATGGGEAYYPPYYVVTYLIKAL
jgi:microcystin-dependent protein